MTANAHFGIIIAHTPNRASLKKSHIGAGELTLARKATGEKKWERIYKYPEKGLGLYMATLGNPEQLGQAIGFFPFINFPLNPGRKFKLFVRAGDGLGIITNPYERTKNHKNNINGTYINEFIYLRLYSIYHVSKRVRMETGIGLTHLSNGNWAVPNLGINIATLNMGLSFHKSGLEQIKQRRIDTTLLRFDRKPFVTVIGSGGVNETNYRNGKKYGTFALAMAVWKPVSQKSRFCIGHDLFYDMSYLAKAEERGTFDTSKKLNNLQAGVRLGYEMVVGKVAMPIEMGYYYHTKTTVNGPLYHRVGLRFYMTEHLILAYTLKTHWATAQNIEFGVGYKF